MATPPVVYNGRVTDYGRSIGYRAPTTSRTSSSSSGGGSSRSSTPPKYNTTTGFVTDYGLSVGAKPTQPGDPAGGNSSWSGGSSSSTPTPVATTTSQAIKDLQTTLNAQNANKTGYVPLVVDGIQGAKTNAALSLYNSGVKSSPTNVVTPEKLATATPIVVPPITPPINVADTLVAGAQAQLTQMQTDETNRIKAAQDAQAAKQTESSNLSKQISSLLDISGGQGKETLEAENAAGVPQMKSQLTTLSNQIQTKLAEYNALNVDIQGKPITMSSIIGAQAQIKNVAAADIGLLQAQASALQGNLDEARSTADRAVELKYSDIKEQINIKVSQLGLIQSDLTAAEKVTAGLLNEKYKRETSELAVQIANEKDMNATLLNAMQTYPDAKISLTDSIEQANAKIVSNSKIYADKIRGPQGGSSSKFEGFTGNETNAIRDSIKKNGLEATISGISNPDEVKEIQFIAKSPTENNEQFFTKDYLLGLFTEDSLKTAADAAGFRKVLTNWKKEKENYINYLMNTVEQYRKAGFTDKEILTKMK